MKKQLELKIEYLNNAKAYNLYILEVCSSKQCQQQVQDKPNSFQQESTNLQNTYTL